jgi:hypothetical protein
MCPRPDDNTVRRYLASGVPAIVSEEGSDRLLEVVGDGRANGVSSSSQPRQMPRD